MSFERTGVEAGVAADVADEGEGPDATARSQFNINSIMTRRKKKKKKAPYRSRPAPRGL